MTKEFLRDITNKETSNPGDILSKLQEQLKKLHSFKDTIQNDRKKNQDIINRTKAVYGDDVSDAPGYDELLVADKRCEETLNKLQMRIENIQMQLDTLLNAKEPEPTHVPMIH